MKTTYRIPAPYAEQFLKLADDYASDSPARPLRFIFSIKRSGRAGDSQTKLSAMCKNCSAYGAGMR